MSNLTELYEDAEPVEEQVQQNEYKIVSSHNGKRVVIMNKFSLRDDK
jgi:hypothetical protein